MEVVVHFRIIEGLELPKTDMLSEIDPWIRFTVNDKEFRTPAIDDNPNPKWNSDFFFVAPLDEEDGRLLISLQLDLMDEEVRGDRHIGSTNLDLSLFSPEDWPLIELPIVYTADRRVKLARQKRNSRIVVAVLGTTVSFDTVADTLAEVPGLVVDHEQQQLFLPLPGAPGIFAGVRYDERRGVLHKLVSTLKPAGPPTKSRRRRNAPVHDGSSHFARQSLGIGVDQRGFWLDFHHKATKSVQVERTCYPRGQRLAHGIKAFEEVTLLGLPLSVDLEAVTLTCEPCTVVSAVNVKAALEAAGWRGVGTSIQHALRDMGGTAVHADATTREIFIGLDATSEPGSGALLLLDYSRDDRRPLLKLCQTKGSNVVYSLLVAGAGGAENADQGKAQRGGGGRGPNRDSLDAGAKPLVSICTTYRKPQKVMGGRGRIVRVVALPNSESLMEAPDGSGLDQLQAVASNVQHAASGADGAEEAVSVSLGELLSGALHQRLYDQQVSEMLRETEQPSLLNPVELGKTGVSKLRLLLSAALAVVDVRRLWSKKKKKRGSGGGEEEEEGGAAAGRRRGRRPGGGGGDEDEEGRGAAGQRSRRSQRYEEEDEGDESPRRGGKRNGNGKQAVGGKAGKGPVAEEEPKPGLWARLRGKNKEKDDPQDVRSAGPGRPGPPGRRPGAGQDVHSWAATSAAAATANGGAGGGGKGRSWKDSLHAAYNNGLYEGEANEQRGGIYDEDEEDEQPGPSRARGRGGGGSRLESAGSSALSERRYGRQPSVSSTRSGQVGKDRGYSAGGGGGDSRARRRAPVAETSSRENSDAGGYGRNVRSGGRR